jgi:hypothetical protein
MNETKKDLPAIGEEMKVRITPSIASGQTWVQFGNLLAVREDTTGLIVGTIRLAGVIRSRQYSDGLRSDNRWGGCEVDAVYNPYSNNWRATRPVCDQAKAVWAKCQEADDDNQ